MKTEKRIRLFLDTGKIYSIAAAEVAHNRAAYYAIKDSENTTYDIEYQYTLNDDHELYDWMENNMGWTLCSTLREEPSDPKPFSECEILEHDVVQVKV